MMKTKELLLIYEEDQAGLVQLGKNYLDSHSLHENFEIYKNVMNNLFTIALKTHTPSLILLLQERLDHLATPENQKDPATLPLLLRWKTALHDCTGE